MSNYSAENVKAVANGEAVESGSTPRRVHVGTISVFDPDQKYEIFSEKVGATDDEVDALEKYLVNEINSLLINEDLYPDEFAAAINKAIEDSGLAPKVVVEKSTK